MYFCTFTFYILTFTFISFYHFHFLANCEHLLFLRNGKGIRGHPDGIWSSIESAVDREKQLDVQGEEQCDGGEEGGGEEEEKKSGEDLVPDHQKQEEEIRKGARS